jgi:predicted GIY-YIG superfamily endonuclease
MNDHEYFVYIMSSRSGTLYIGMTNSIYRRALQHKSPEVEGFASKYHCNRLVYYESFDDCSPRHRKRERTERLAENQEDCPDRIEKSKVGRSSRKMGSATAVRRRINEEEPNLILRK